MGVIRIESLDDPAVADYRNLKDRDLAARTDDSRAARARDATGSRGAGSGGLGSDRAGRDGAERGGRFIAEGEQLVRRLLASRIETVSVLLAARRAGEIAPIVPPDVPVFVAPDQLVNCIIGFKFHSGVMAVGRRPRRIAIHEIIPPAVVAPRRLTIVVCPEPSNTENLGALIRIAAGFGADALVLGERSCDPFFRQSVRVSMGAAFSLPIVQSLDLCADLMRLKRDHGFELVASVVGRDNAIELGRFQRSDRTAILFGNEAQGLRAEEIALCDRSVTIPMRLGTDSLNVAVAAGVILYELTRQT